MLVNRHCDVHRLVHLSNLFSDYCKGTQQGSEVIVIYPAKIVLLKKASSPIAR